MGAVTSRWLGSGFGFLRRSSERYLVAESVDRRFEVTAATVDHLTNTIRITDHREVRDLEAVQRPFLKSTRLVVALDSHQATTVTAVVTVHRSRPQDLIGEAELDGLTFRALWEFLNRYRSWAAKKMGSNELDLVLTGTEIGGVEIDGHSVFNPTGFKGKRLAVRLCGTFVPRALVSPLERWRRWTRSFHVLENGSALAEVLTAANEYLVLVMDTATAIYGGDDRERRYVAELPWGFDKVAAALAAEYRVAPEEARAMIERYASGDVSARAGRLLDRTIRGAFDQLITLAKPVLRQGAAPRRAAIHLSFRFPMPTMTYLEEELRAKSGLLLKQVRDRGITLEVPPRLRLEFEPKIRETTVALLVYPYQHPQYLFMNQLLRRRAKWLITLT